MTKAVAREGIRKQWSADCSDEGLDNLVNGWIPHGSERYEKFKEDQDNRCKKVAKLLSIYMIRCDEKSKIRGVIVMIDYFKQCKLFEDPQNSLDNTEHLKREELFQKRFSNTSNRITSIKNDWMWCLSYSDRFYEWEKNGRKPETWIGYTLEEGEKHVRMKALIEYLRNGKRTGNGVIIFAQCTFLMELALKVMHQPQDID